MNRADDPAWIRLIEVTIANLVAQNTPIPEIKRALLADFRDGDEFDVIWTRLELLVATNSKPRATRPRLVPNVAAAMDAAIAALVTERIKRLTWQNVATRMADDCDLQTLDESTLRRYAKEDGLPPPWDARWRRSG